MSSKRETSLKVHAFIQQIALQQLFVANVAFGPGNTTDSKRIYVTCSGWNTVLSIFTYIDLVSLEHPYGAALLLSHISNE